MALFPRIRLRALMLHVRDVLRTGINAQITAAIAEEPSNGAEVKPRDDSGHHQAN